ncbi:hypothetical protein DYB32_001405 [Aphanomyces invadans]|uniref:Uncharacterized protein n=1 Tax=Aphanomyces invadans TaxID=157072 RepID=A0A3R6VS70_9STRA|nr:hypothetical protein DYB32_001405 [Aphanomyces invadans]
MISTSKAHVSRPWRVLLVMSSSKTISSTNSLSLAKKKKTCWTWRLVSLQHRDWAAK